MDHRHEERRDRRHRLVRARRLRFSGRRGARLRSPLADGTERQRGRRNPTGGLQEADELPDPDHLGRLHPEREDSTRPTSGPRLYTGHSAGELSARRADGGGDQSARRGRGERAACRRSASPATRTSRCSIPTTARSRGCWRTTCARRGSTSAAVVERARGSPRNRMGPAQPRGRRRCRGAPGDQSCCTTVDRSPTQIAPLGTPGGPSTLSTMNIRAVCAPGAIGSVTKVKLWVPFDTDVALPANRPECTHGRSSCPRISPPGKSPGPVFGKPTPSLVCTFT